MRKNFLKIFTTIITISFILSAFAACKNSALDYNRVSDGKNLNNADKAIISFRVDEKNLERRTEVIDVKEEDIVKVSLNIELYEKDDSTETTLVMGEDTLSFTESEDGTKSPIDVFEANILYLDPGTYKFTVFLYVNDAVHGDYVVQTGELDKITVKSGENEPLLFKTNYKAFGDISVNFKFSFEDLPVGSTEAEITAAKAKIMAYHVNAGLFYEIDKEGTQGVINPVNYKKDDGEEINYGFEKVVFEEDDITITKNDDNEDIWTVNINYSKNDVPNGSYYICFEILEEDPSDPALQYRRNIYIDIAKIKGYKTTGDCELSNTNTVFNVTYELNGGEWAQDYLAPDTHTPNQGIILPNNDEEPLISRAGYTFLGWLDEDEYDNDSTYNENTSYIPAGKEYARDFHFKAQWGFNYELYVSSGGNDSYDDNDGFTLNTAFASLQKAVDYIKDYESSEDDHIEGFFNYEDKKEWKIYVSGNIGTESAPSVTEISDDITDTQAASILISGLSKNTLEDGTYDANSYIDILNAILMVGGKESNNGSVLTIQTSVPVTIQNIKITGGNGYVNGGGIDVEAGTLTIAEGTLIIDNHAVEGGGLYIAPGAEVYMTGGEITGNRDNYSSDVCHYGRLFSMSGSTLISQMLSSDGAPIGEGVIFLKNDFDSNGKMTGIHRTVTLGGELTRALSTGEKIARIKANKYVAGMTVLTGSKGYMVTADDVNKFAMAESGYMIVDSGDDVGKLKSSSVGGNVTTIDGVIDIFANIIYNKLYVNKGSIELTALPKGESSLPQGASITWSAKLLYGGIDINDYSETSKPFYEFVENPAPCLSIKNTLEVAGNYQLFVTAIYKADDFSPAITSSQTFNLNINDYCVEVNCTNNFKDTFQQLIRTALDYSVPLDIKLTGTGTVSDDEDSDTLAIIKSVLSDIETDVYLDLSEVSGIETIPEGAFIECDCLKSIKLPISTKTIANGAFMRERDNENDIDQYYSPIEYISFYDTVETIEEIALPSMNQIIKFEIIETEAENPVFSTAENDSILLKRTSEVGTPLTQRIVCVANDYKADVESIDFSNNDELAYVTEIPDNAFFMSTKLQTVNFGNVTNIGEASFYYCPELTEVTFTTNGVEIGQSAFALCEGLTNIDLSNVSKIYNQAFFGTGLTEVTIPAGIDFPEDDNQAFYTCTSLETVTMEAGFDKDITGVLFERCENITSFEIIGNYSENQTTRYYAMNNGSLLVKKEIDEIENDELYIVIFAANASDDIETIDFSNDDEDSNGLSLSDIDIIGPLAFALNEQEGFEEHPNAKLKTIASFGNIERICDEAFKCSKIETIGEFKENLSVGKNAFANSSLSSIPPIKKGMSFYDYVFANTNVNTFEFESADIHVYGNPAFQVKFERDEDDYEGDDEFEITIILDFDITADDPDEPLEKLKPNYTKTTNNQTENYLLKGIKNYSKITELVLNGKVILPDDDVNRTNNVFSDIGEYLEKISFLGEGSEIGAYQFCGYNDGYNDYYKNIQEIDLTGVTKIGDNAFQKTYLLSLDLKNVQVIGKEAFDNTQLHGSVTINIPSSVIAVGYKAFYTNNYAPNIIIEEESGVTWYETSVASKWEEWIDGNYDNMLETDIVSDNEGGWETIKQKLKDYMSPDSNQPHEYLPYIYKKTN
jgi:hypothetical protein